jgi:hypothetical protein
MFTIKYRKPIFVHRSVAPKFHFANLPASCATGCTTTTCTINIDIIRTFTFGRTPEDNCLPVVVSRERKFWRRCHSS